MESLPKAVEDCSSLTELHAWDNGMKDISKVDFSETSRVDGIKPYA